MGIPERMRLIEKLYAERDEAASKVAELEQFREEEISEKLVVSRE